MTTMVKLVKWPSADDWLFCKQCALCTVNKTAVTAPDLEWKKKILRARHSPIRELHFAFELRIPYWVSVHLCRHVHAQPYVRSQRNDRQNQYDRNSAPQDAPVKMIWSMNAEELMTIANKRLCNKASEETRDVVKAMCALVLNECPEFEGLLISACVYHGKCNEMYPCGRVNDGA